MVKAHFFLEQFVPNRPTDPALRKQEGEMFMLMYFSSDSCDTLAAFAHHPNIGYANVQSLCTGALVEDSISFESYAMYDANTMAILQGRLAKLATDPFPGYTFRDYTTAVCTLFELLRSEEHDYYFKANAALLEDLLQDLNDGFFQSATLDSGRVKALLEQALTEARQTPDATGTVCIYPVYTGEATTVFQPYPHREVYSDFVLIPEG
jgi:hypothetical protein